MRLLGVAVGLCAILRCTCMGWTHFGSDDSFDLASDRPVTMHPSAASVATKNLRCDRARHAHTLPETFVCWGPPKSFNESSRVTAVVTLTEVHEALLTPDQPSLQFQKNCWRRAFCASTQKTSLDGRYMIWDVGRCAELSQSFDINSTAFKGNAPRSISSVTRETLNWFKDVTQMNSSAFKCV